MSIFRKLKVCESRDAYLILIYKLGSIKKIIIRTVIWRSTNNNRVAALYYTPNSVDQSLTFKYFTVGWQSLAYVSLMGNLVEKGKAALCQTLTFPIMSQISLKINKY